jgi:hypothetical protein
MRPRIFSWPAVIALLGVMGVAASSADLTAEPARRSAVAYLTEPTLVGGIFIAGPVQITHDADRMARGGPCTEIRLFDPAKNHATDVVASFHCIPRRAAPVSHLTITTRPSPYGFGCELASYQFANDSEVHGVPATAAAH